MKKIIIFLILLVVNSLAFGQSKKRKQIPPPPQPSISDTLREIPQKKEYTKYKIKTRQTFYPFNKATQIKMVSFDKQTDEDVKNKSLEAINIITEETYGLPIKSNSIDFTKISQTKTLKENEIDTLTDLLYNTCSRWNITQTSKAGCYYPHNAIIFFDKLNQAFEYIELCFDCNQLKYSNKKIRKFDDCDIALYELRNYFKSFGIKTSTEEFKKYEQ